MMREHRMRYEVRGFSLVEALVALVVLSIGMLGIAALYVESLQMGRAALLRTQAVVQAADMADRIRANLSAGDSYKKGLDDKGTTTPACIPPASAGCTAAQMAAQDIYFWHRMVDDRDDSPGAGRLALPDGRGKIDVSTTTPRVYTIRIEWSESGQSGKSSYETRVQG